MKKNIKRILPIATAIVSVGVFTPFISSCNTQESKVIAIEITSTPEMYYSGQQFKHNSLVVKATFEDGSVNENYTHYATDPQEGYVFNDDDVSSGKTITVSRDGVSDSFKAIVKKDSVKGINIDDEALVKKHYYAGERLTLEGLKVYAEWNSGKVELIEDKSSIDSFPAEGYGFQSTDVAEEYPVTIRYFDGQKYHTYDFLYVQVEADFITKLEVTSLPTKTTFYVDTLFEKEGLKLKATYASGNVDEDYNYYQTIPNNGYIFKDSDVNNNFPVSVLVNDKKWTEFNINVEKDYISRLLITAGPTKTDYFAGEKLNIDGLKVWAKYASGKTVKDFKDFTIDPGTDYIFTNEDAKNGSKTFYVKCDKGVAQFTVKVSRMAMNIKVTTLPTKTTFRVERDPMDYAGMVVTAYYEDGTSETVTSYTPSVEPGHKFGAADIINKYLITINYQYCQYGFYISIIDSVEKIEVTTPPSKLTYNVGDKLDLTGMKVTATTFAGDQSDVTSVCTTDPASGYTFEKAGTYTITVTYTEEQDKIQTTFDVTVIE